MTTENAYRWLMRRKNRYFRAYLEKYTPEYNWRYPHLLFLQERLELALEQAVSGKAVKLIIMMPPRHGKSSIITERFPAYCMHKRPYWKVIVGAHNDRKAEDFTRKIRRLTTQSGIRLSSEKAAAGEWETVHGGGAKSAGMQTGIAGWGANVMIIDDPVRNRADANSEVVSDKIYNEFWDSFLPRLHKINMTIIVTTNWSLKGLPERLIADDPTGWEVINIPAIARENDILGRKEGEALCPELIPLKHLLMFKEKRPRTFESLYQGNPSVAAGDIFLREWFNYHDDKPKDVTRTIFSVDTAFKEKSTSDYSVIGKWHETESQGYLDDVHRERMSYPKLRSCLLAMADEAQPDLVMIEDKASGQSLIQDLHSSTRLPIVPVQADVSKTARAHAATGQFESGNISFRRNDTWLREYEDELLVFDNGAYDDQVDMTTHYINNIMKHVNDFIIV